jgi:hypothetical protein
MTQTSKGRLVFLAALGMMAGLLAPEVAALSAYPDALQPAFLGKLLGHFAAVVTAYVGGSLIPTKDE